MGGDLPRPKRPGSILGDRGETRVTTAPPPGSELDRLRKEAEAARAKLKLRSGTPVHGTPIEIVEARAKRAADNSLAAATTIVEVRAEMLESDRRIEKRLDSQDVKLDEHGKAIAAVSGDVREINGSLKVLVGELQEHRAAQREAARIKVAAVVAVEEADGLDRVKARADGRGFRLAVLTLVVAPIVGALIAWAKGWL